jgi:hypothetical protein
MLLSAISLWHFSHTFFAFIFMVFCMRCDNRVIMMEGKIVSWWCEQILNRFLSFCENFF